MELTAFIVDDEQQTRETLKALLQQFCPEVIITGMAGSAKEAEAAIRIQRPDILFLDIDLGNNITGFDILDSLHKYDCAVVFITAHEEHAVKAFEYAAMHYLLKPVNYNMLIDTVYRIRKMKKLAAASDIKQLTDTFHQTALISSSRIALSDMNKTDFILLDDIVYLESNGSYTIFHLNDKRHYTKSKNLKYFEDSFSSYSPFVRVHKSYIVNKQHIKAYRKNSSELELSTGVAVPMSIGYRSLIAELGGNFIQ